MRKRKAEKKTETENTREEIVKKRSCENLQDNIWRTRC